MVTGTWMASCFAPPAFGDGSGRIAPESVPTVSLVAGQDETVLPGLAADGREFLSMLCAGLGTPVQCFTPPNPSTGRYLNVASFFDRRQRSDSNHYFLKFFDNAAGELLEITGISMHVSWTMNLRTFPAVGVVRTSRDAPVLPSPVELLNLQVVNVQAQVDRAELCVAIPQARLLPDESAWLVVRFPVTPQNAQDALILILVDDDSEDLQCDYMTRDAGQYYYRPDPRNGPALDWAITAYTTPVVRKPSVPWSQVKRLYRDTETGTSGTTRQAVGQ